MTRLRRTAVLLAVVLLAACGDSASPPSTLDGVWGARAGIRVDGDSLAVALSQEGSEVEGFGILRLSGDLRNYIDMYLIAGSVSGRSVELRLTRAILVDHSQQLLRGTLSRGELALTITTSSGEKQIVLRPSSPHGPGLAGTYALVSGSLRDTVVALPDGRARRHRIESSFAYSTRAMWSRRGDWLVLDQLHFGSSGVPHIDSLRIQSGALVRTTPLSDGTTRIETYQRVP